MTTVLIVLHALLAVLGILAVVGKDPSGQAEVMTNIFGTVLAVVSILTVLLLRGVIG